MYVCTLTACRSSFSISLKGARQEWVTKEQRLRETHNQSLAILVSGRSLLAAKSWAIDLPYCNAAKQRNKLLSRGGKTTQGSNLPGRVILWNLSCAFFTGEWSLQHNKPWYHHASKNHIPTMLSDAHAALLVMFSFTALKRAQQEEELGAYCQ